MCRYLRNQILFERPFFFSIFATTFAAPSSTATPCGTRMSRVHDRRSGFLPSMQVLFGYFWPSGHVLVLSLRGGALRAPKFRSLSLGIECWLGAFQVSRGSSFKEREREEIYQPKITLKKYQFGEILKLASAPLANDGARVCRYTFLK